MRITDLNDNDIVYTNKFNNFICIRFHICKKIAKFAEENVRIYTLFK